MANDPLALLASIERQELDRERRALAASLRAIDDRQREREALKAAFGPELKLGLELPDGPRLAAAYALGSRQRDEVLAGELRRLEAGHAGLEAALSARILRLKTFELAAERRAARAQAERERVGQARLDEAATLRYAAARR